MLGPDPSIQTPVVAPRVEPEGDDGVVKGDDGVVRGDGVVTGYRCALTSGCRCSLSWGAII